MSVSYTIVELAEIVGGTVRGESAGRIDGINDVSEATPTQATWVLRPGYAEKLSASRAGVVLVASDFGPTPMPAILCTNMERAVAQLLGAFARPISEPAKGVHPTAVIDPAAGVGRDVAIGPNVVMEGDVRVGRGCKLYAGVFLGRGAAIGDGCVLWPNVVVRDGCILGDRVIIHSNAVIGTDGFGYYFDGCLRKIPHVGAVRIEDDVEIGACSCVDRAKFGFTIVGRGTKIDNLVQIGHNVRVGADCVLAGQVGVSGSVRIGDGCAFGGQAGAVDNVSIAGGTQLGARSLVTRDVPTGTTMSGWPLQELPRAMRTQALILRLPELAAQVKELAARVQKLESTTHDSS
ncbi:MAG: UDP-3-O-(3-hydroxymyristoyl)glucosamine N-acyltransferase [Planctomycetota bacterium]